MFEDICLTCSKRLPDDGRAYCSDECELLDAYNSPSISTASSTLSSPHLDYIVGDNVPPLVPSALSTALSTYGKPDRYFNLSSSVSSASWSLSTDASEEDAPVSMGDDLSYDIERLDVPLDDFSHISGTQTLRKSSNLNYTRCPSTTNHRSLIPLLHSRTPSMSSFTGARNSLPMEDDVDSLHKIPHNHQQKVASQHEHGTTKSTVGPKTRKSRNRVSLPAYFSLLQVNVPRRSPPLSSSSGNTVNTNNQASPPTPKLASLLTASGLRSTVEATPHGRRHEGGSSRSRRRSQSCHSCSKGDENTTVPVLGRGSRQGSRSSVEQIFDWTCTPVARGRTTRRNSSPLPKMMLSMQEFEDLALTVGPLNYLDEKRRHHWTDEVDNLAFCGPLAHQNGQRNPRERGRKTASRR